MLNSVLFFGLPLCHSLEFAFSFLSSLGLWYFHFSLTCSDNLRNACLFYFHMVSIHFYLLYFCFHFTISFRIFNYNETVRTVFMTWKSCKKHFVYSLNTIYFIYILVCCISYKFYYFYFTSKSVQVIVWLAYSGFCTWLLVLNTWNTIILQKLHENRTSLIILFFHIYYILNSDSDICIFKILIGMWQQLFNRSKSKINFILL